MRSHARVWFLALLTGVLLAAFVPAPGQAAVGAEAVPGTGLFKAPGPECEESEIGTQEATVYTGSFEKGGAGDVPLKGPVFDLVPDKAETMANGQHLAALYGVSIPLPKF